MLRRALLAPALLLLHLVLVAGLLFAPADPSGSGLWSRALAQEAAQERPSDTEQAAPRKPAEIQAQLDAWKIEIDQIAAGTQRDNLTDRVLADLRARAEAVRGRAGGIVDLLAPNVEAIEARLKQLGPVPDPKAKDADKAAPESDAVKQDRDAQNKALAELQGFVKQATLIQLKADEVIRAIGDKRRDRFTRTLLEQTRSVLDPTLWYEAAAAIPGTTKAFGLLLSDWGRLLMERAGQSAFAALGLTLVFFAVLVRPVRRRLGRWTERDPDLAEPTPFQKSAAAAAIVFLNTVLPLAGLMTIYGVLDGFDLSPERIDQTLLALMSGFGVGAAVWSLAGAILAPGRPQWRLLVVPDQAASQLVRLFGLLAFTFGIGAFLVRLMPVLAAPIALVIAVAGFFALLDILLMVLALRTVAGSLATTEEASETAHATPSGEQTHVTGSQRAHSILWRWLVPLAWLAAIAGVVSAAIGYAALARFISTQMLWAGLNLAALYILLILVDELFGATFKRDTAVGASLNRSMGFARETVEQVGVVMSGLSRLVLIGLVVALILWPLGYTSEDLVGEAKSAFFGFRVGGLTISPSSILAALAVFMIAIAVTRGVQGWLGNRFLPRTRLDAGLKNSILTAFGYVGFVIAAMLAFSSVGLNLENIAIVAGALSVGVGFGLQSIVNNFVSGLILLAERPIKAGDLVEIGNEKGFVRKINVRSTEIETFDRASLIVPNSSLISGTVKNWMHRDMTGRCVVNIGVDYTADPERVKDILLAAAKAHKLVMYFPPPNVFFVNFGESALEFRLVCTVPNVNDAFGVESELRFEVVKRLRSEGIEIPYAQRDLHIRQLDDIRALAEEFLHGSKPKAVAAPKAEG